jgi:hypothetical protein
MAIKYQQGDVLFIKQENVDTDKGWNIIKGSDNNEILQPGKNVPGYHSNKVQSAHVNGQAKGKKLTVAFGEVTGHSHSFYMDKNPPGVEITAFGRRRTSVGDIPQYVNIEGESTINHEEHNALTMPTGLYEVRIVQEFDHIAGRARNVVD